VRTSLRAHTRATFRAGTGSGASLKEGFELAQWALQSSTADALSQMSARFAKGTGSLANLVRERQDIINQHREHVRRLDQAFGYVDAKGEAIDAGVARITAEEERASIAALDVRLDALDAKLRDQFKDYAELANPRPLSIATA